MQIAIGEVSSDCVKVTFSKFLKSSGTQKEFLNSLAGHLVVACLRNNLVISSTLPPSKLFQIERPMGIAVKNKTVHWSRGVMKRVYKTRKPD